MDIMRALEPRKEERGVILFNELEEMNEVLFFTRGSYEIGYNFNGQSHFKIKYKNSNVIGAYGVTFFKCSQFIYRTCTKCTGFSIRKSNWLKIINTNE